MPVIMYMQTGKRVTISSMYLRKYIMKFRKATACRCAGGTVYLVSITGYYIMIRPVSGESLKVIRRR